MEVRAITESRQMADAPQLRSATWRRVVGALARKELREALRTRWFLLYTLALTFLSGGLSYLSTAFSGYAGLQGFGRAAAGLVNLVLLVVPLMGLTAGALTFAGERERRTLGYLLSQPVSALEVFIGKTLGLTAAMVTGIGFSFGVVGVLLGMRGAPMDGPTFAGFTALTVLLSLVGLALGVLISSMATRVAGALGATVFLWLTLVFLGDLGVMGTVLVTRIGVDGMMAAALINPLQEYRVAAIALLSPRLEVLGPAGLYLVDVLGTAVVPVLTGLLFAWIVFPLFMACWLFTRGDAA